MRVLALNSGSSSVKYALFDDDVEMTRGDVERVADAGATVPRVLAALPAAPEAVGHRLVHGGSDHVAPELVDDRVLDALGALLPFAPLHLPGELAAIRAVRDQFGELPQVVCFDTAFHSTLPDVARRFALPARLFAAGVRRYGFHGLSYEYIASRLPRDRLARAVFAHLGAGASMVAVRDGRSIDTTMGFSPTGGLVMATRSGDLDPGLVVYLLDHGYDSRRLDRLVNHEAGLLAVAETTADMRDLLARRTDDPRAAFAIDVFCYHARKAIGGLAAVLGGVDPLVFTGGIGAHAAAVRAAICDGLQHLGIELDAVANARGNEVIGRGACDVRAMATNEELVVARATRATVTRARGATR